MKTKSRVVLAAVAASAVVASPAFALAPTSLTELIAGISLADLTTAVLSIGALVIGVDLAQLGYMKVRRLVKGGH